MIFEIVVALLIVFVGIPLTLAFLADLLSECLEEFERIADFFRRVKQRLSPKALRKWPAPGPPYRRPP